MAQECISRISEKFEGKVTKNLPKEFSRVESRILGALSKLDEFLLNPQFRTYFVAVPGTSSNNKLENREHNRNRFQGDACPEAVFFVCRPINLYHSEQEENYHMVTGVQENFPYCSHGTSSRIQNKTRSTSQPKVCCENSPATNEADQNRLGPQHLARNTNLANFINNIIRISKMPKSLLRTKPTFDLEI